MKFVSVSEWTSWDILDIRRICLVFFEPKAFCCSDIGNRVKRDSLASFFWIPMSLFFPQKKEKAAVAKQTFYRIIQHTPCA